jgi:hypothetical protein
VTVAVAVTVSVAVSVTVSVSAGRVRGSDRGSESAARPRLGHLRLLAHAGVVDKRGIATVLATFDEVRAMTWRLLNPRE